MKKVPTAFAAASAAVLALALAVGCSQPIQQKEAPPEDAVSIEELLSGLDSLGAVRTKALVPADSIRKSATASFTADEMSAFLAGIRVAFASYVANRPENSPYLVLPVRLRSEGQSALMWVPVSLGRRLSVPVVAYQHGTQLNRSAAPSRFDPNPLSILSAPDVTGAFMNYVECVAGALMASAGYIVVMPDYPGFGDSAVPHPFVHLSLGDSARLMLDRAKAVLSSPFAAARPNGRLYLIGYSEGGFATMAAARTLQNLGRTVTAAVPCAGSYDLSGVMLAEVLSGAEAKVPYYIPYTIHGYASVYRSVEPAAWDFSALLVPPLPSLLPLFFDGSASGAAVTAAIDAYVGTRAPRNMLTGALLAELSAGTGAVYGRLRENTVFHTGWVPGMILQMVHCPADDVVPAANAAAVYAAYGALPNVLPPLWVPPLPFGEELADVHLRAFPTALLAGFTFLDGVESRF